MVLQSFKMAISAILSNKMRSFLTMLGVIIGVVALVVLVSLVSSATDSITDQVSSMGTDMITVSILDDKENPLRLAELDALAQKEEIECVAASTTTRAIAKLGSTSENANVYGVTSSYAQINGQNVEYGRFLRATDVENSSYVAVISHEAAQKLYGRANVVGETFTLGGRPMLVVGVLEDSENMMAALLGGDMTAYVPYTVATRMAGTSSKVTSFEVASTRSDTLNDAEATLTDWLMSRFKEDEDAFRVFNRSMIMDTMGSITGTLSLVLGGIAAISLLVGGIGIMNIMLVSVTERTREIGIRKAIGAGRSSILIQFLLEALTLSLIGCAIGVLASWGLISAITAIAGEALTFTISLNAGVIALAVTFSAGIGVLFGVYPASKAAGKNPIEALRYDG